MATRPDAVRDVTAWAPVSSLCLWVGGPRATATTSGVTPAASAAQHPLRAREVTVATIACGTARSALDLHHAPHQVSALLDGHLEGGVTPAPDGVHDAPPRSASACGLGSTTAS